MPEPAEILAGLSQVANEAVLVAILWHVVTALALMLLLTGWRPSRRTALALLAAPVLSVSFLSFTHHNPFNGTMFALFAAALLGVAWSLESGRVTRGPGWAVLAGGAMIAFAWLYPHFLIDRPELYLVAAPLGLVPGPTLALAVGFVLLGGGLHSRLASLVVIGAAITYGFIGWFALGVALDAILLAGAAALLVLVSFQPEHA